MNVEIDKVTLDKLVSKLGELPSAPVILNKALNLSSDLQTNIPELTKIITADQSLSAKIIRLSNSPAYGRITRISSLDEAIKVLGFTNLKSILVTATTFQMFEESEHSDIANDLWHHSLATAIGSRLIAKRFGRVDKEQAYLCGLLHDIGKLVLLKIIPHVYEKIIETVKENETSFIDVENREMEFSHVDVARTLLQNWNFPNNLITQISGHHSVDITQESSQPSLAGTVAIANGISRYIGASFYDPYNHIEYDALYYGEKKIEDEEIISLRIDTEELLNIELNNYQS